MIDKKKMRSPEARARRRKKREEAWAWFRATEEPQGEVQGDKRKGAPNGRPLENKST